MKKTAVNRLLPHLGAIAVFILLAAAYFFPQLQGEKIVQGDILSYHYMSHEALKFHEDTGQETHWTNSMFGGMPTYQITSPVKGNLTRFVERITMIFFSDPMGNFIALMIGMYILLQVLGLNVWLSIIGAVAFGFTTNNLILYEAGHMSKVRAIAYFAPIVAGVILAYRGKWLWGAVLFTTALAIDIYVNHPQMTYYLAMVLVIYVVWQLVGDLRSGKLLDFAKASALLLLGTVLAVAASYSKISSTMEYAKDTMRGDPILQTQGQVTTSSQVKGLEWGYAMQWSNGLMDLVASYIPGVVGGGSQEPVGDDSAFAKFLRSRNARVPADLKAPLYWGDLPFTSGPAYFGSAVFFLFVLGLFLVRGQLKWWIGLGVLFTLLLSMGKHFEPLNRLFFNVLPMYNNFRSPNSILAVTAFLTPVLAFVTVSQILTGQVAKAEVLKWLKVVGGSMAAIALFFALLGPSFFDFTASGDEELKNAGYDIGALIADRQSLMRMDGLRAFVLVAITAGLIWAFLSEKIKKSYLLAGLGILTLFDMWSVGKRYLSNDNFISDTAFQQNFNPRAVDEQILQDKDLNYRVLDLSVNTFNSAMPSYFHKTIGGYHAAKLQRYQDIIDRHISKGNERVLNMLNTRYVISKDEKVQRNPGALGNAWFVDTLLTAASADEEIDLLTTIDPRTQASVHKEFADYVARLTPKGSQGTILLTAYQPNKVSYQSNNPVEQLAVFSEIWYGPGKGWQAYLDGKPVDHIRVNYCLRGLRIPAGQHEIVFEFKPNSFAKGEVVSYFSSSIILLALLGMIGWSGWNWYRNLPEAEVVKRVEKTAPKPAHPPKKKR
jgi:hypothetical protein